MMGHNHVVANVATVYTLSNAVLIAQTTGALSALTAQLPAAKGVEAIAVTSIGELAPIACAIAALVGFLFGSLLPDIDSPTALVGRWFSGVFRTHRGITHTIWALLAVGFVWVAMSAAYIASDILWMRCLAYATGGVFFGYLGHLLWDAVSRSGIAWFYPLTGYITYSSGARIKKGFHPWIYRTNSISESVVVFVLVALVFITAAIVWSLMPEIGAVSVQGAVDDVVLNGAASLRTFTDRLVMFVVNPFVLLGIL